MRLVFDIECDHFDLSRITRLWCICFHDLDNDREYQFGPNQVPQALDLLAEANDLIGHNISEFDLTVLRNLYGFETRATIVDTLILSRLIRNDLSNPDGGDRYGRHGLDAWGKRLHLTGKSEFGINAKTRKPDPARFRQWDPQMLPYCMNDVRLTTKLLEHLMNRRPSPRAVRLELEYAALIRRIEQHGFTLDIAAVEDLRERINQNLEQLQLNLDSVFPPTETPSSKPRWYRYQVTQPCLAGMAGDTVRPTESPEFTTIAALEAWRKGHGVKPRECRRIDGPTEPVYQRFNANSSKQVIDGLRSLGWVADGGQFTKNGLPRTSESILLHCGVPIGRTIALFKALTKLRGFTDQWLKYTRDGKIFPRFTTNQAATNRSSGRSPNLQQIPKTGRMEEVNEYAQKCRRLFQPQPGYHLVGADLAGIELRLLGHRLAPYDDGDFARLVSTSPDLHQENANRIGITRDQAKTVTYGSMYGQGPTSLSQSLGLSRREASEILDSFTSGIPGFARMQEDLHSQWKTTGKVELVDGRQLFVGSAHRILNYAIQGDAGILFKRWVMLACRELQNTSWRLLAIVHDEQQGECFPKHVERCENVLRKTATIAGENLGLKVAVEADTKPGYCWAETH